MPHVLVFAPAPGAVDVPFGEARPAEHVRVRVEHAAAHRPAGSLGGCGRARRPPRCRCGRDGARRRARRCGCRRPGSTRRRRGAGSRAGPGRRPCDRPRSRGSRSSDDAVPWSYPILGWRPGAPHSPRTIAHRDAVDVERLAVQREVAGDPTRLVDVRAVVERRRLTGEQRLAERLEGEVERQVVVVAAEAEHAAGLEAAEPHPAVQVRGVEQVRRLGQRFVPAPLERGQLPRHGGRVVDHEHAHRTGCPCWPGTPDRSTRAGCARAPSRRTRRSPSTTGRRSRAGGTGRPRGRAPSRRVRRSCRRVLLALARPV